MCMAGAIGAAASHDTGKAQPDAQEHAKALARIMILDGRYFPQELYSDKERKSASFPDSRHCTHASAKPMHL